MGSDASFDLITCNMVAEHLPDPVAIFQEMSRVLAPGGTFMVHTPNTRNYLVFANILAKKLLPRWLILKLVRDGRAAEDIYPTYYRANNARTLRHLGESVKLQPHSSLNPSPTAASLRQTPSLNFSLCKRP